MRTEPSLMLREIKSIRVALVDDEPEVRSLFAKILATQSGLEVVAQGASGRDALQIASRERPDVLVMDVNMPVMSGIDAAERIAGAFPSIGIILVTGNESVDLVKRALRVRVMEFLN